MKRLLLSLLILALLASVVAAQATKARLQFYKPGTGWVAANGAPMESTGWGPGLKLMPYNYNGTIWEPLLYLAVSTDSVLAGGAVDTLRDTLFTAATCISVTLLGDPGVAVVPYISAKNDTVFVFTRPACTNRTKYKWWVVVY